jgi:hypothetical protein
LGLAWKCKGQGRESGWPKLNAPERFEWLAGSKLVWRLQHKPELSCFRHRFALRNRSSRNLDGLELGSLKGNQGDRNYDLPANADLNQYQAVVIYCERFHAVFGVARLEKF